MCASTLLYTLSHFHAILLVVLYPEWAWVQGYSIGTAQTVIPHLNMGTQLYDALLPKHKNALLQHTYHNQQFEFATFSLPPPHTRCCTAYYQSCDLQSGSWCIFSGCLHNLQQQMFVLHEGQRKKETRCQWLEQHVTHTAYIQYCNQSTLVTSSSIQYAKICHVLNHDSLTLSKKIGS